MKASEILQLFTNVRQTGESQYIARCPAHNDTNSSLSICVKSEDEILMKCFAGCKRDEILAAVGLSWKDLPQKQQKKTDVEKYGLTVNEYAAARHFDTGLLYQNYVYDYKYQNKTRGQNDEVFFHDVVKMEYRNINSQCQATRFRHCLNKYKDGYKFSWEKGAKICLYGLWHLQNCSNDTSIILVEGESDTHAIWHSVGFGQYKFMPIGIAGATNYSSVRDDLELQRFDKIYVHIEKDIGGKNLFDSLTGANGKESSALLSKMFFFSLDDKYKDPCQAWSDYYWQHRNEWPKFLNDALQTAKTHEYFSCPKAWKELEQQNNQQMKKPDGRAVTSVINGVRGGRPRADYLMAARSFYISSSQNGVYYKYLNGKYWQYNNQKGIYENVPNDIFDGRLDKWLQDQPKEFFDLVNFSRSKKARLEVANQLISPNFYGHYFNVDIEPYSFIDNMELRDYICFANGILNLSGYVNALREKKISLNSQITPYFFHHTKDIFFTKSLPYNFDVTAQCPKFDRFLDEICPDSTERALIPMAISTAFFKSVRFGVAYLFYGCSGSGKSTLAQIIGELLGGDKNYTSLKFSDISRFTEHKLAEYNANIIEEVEKSLPNDGMKLLSSMFKNAVTGGKVHIEYKGKDSEDDKPATAKWLMFGNEIPQFFEKSDAINERMVIFRLSVKIRSTEKEIPNYARFITNDELPGIFIKCLRAYIILMSYKRFPITDNMRLRINANSLTNNPLGAYIKDNFEVGTPLDGINISYEYGRCKEIFDKFGKQSSSLMNFYTEIRNSLNIDISQSKLEVFKTNIGEIHYIMRGVKRKENNNNLNGLV